MAARQQTRTSRLLRHAGKKVRTTLRGCRPSAVKGRFVAPRVLLNSIPKAGTHLLESALEQYPLLRNLGHRTASCWDQVSPRTLRLVRTIGRGGFLNGHLTARPELLELIELRDIKVLFVVRDPRDIAVSHFKYVSDIDLTHPAHGYFQSLPDDSARLLASIEGVPGLKASIGEMLERFSGWLDNSNTLVCRFEDLIGTGGGGSRERQLKVLQEVADFLGIVSTPGQLERIADRTFSTRSSTFRQGRSGGWRNHFTTRHIEVFKRVAGDELVRYGYETDTAW